MKCWEVPIQNIVFENFKTKYEWNMRIETLYHNITYIGHHEAQFISTSWMPHLANAKCTSCYLIVHSTLTSLFVSHSKPLTFYDYFNVDWMSCLTLFNLSVVFVCIWRKSYPSMHQKNKRLCALLQWLSIALLFVLTLTWFFWLLIFLNFSHHQCSPSPCVTILAPLRVI